jgi:hypothetical protein
MTKKLEQLFNLPEEEKQEKQEQKAADTKQGEQESDTQEESQMTISTSLGELDKIEKALPAVRGLEASDKEMDDLSDKATASFDDLMDLGMNVDSRFAADIFSVASTMLGHAVTAKNAKINKKLKTIDLQLKKMRLDQQQAKQDDNAESETGTGVVLDRNALLDRLLNKSDTDSNTKE